jgi:hypothetical protein
MLPVPHKHIESLQIARTCCQAQMQLAHAVKACFTCRLTSQVHAKLTELRENNVVAHHVCVADLVI